MKIKKAIIPAILCLLLVLSSCGAAKSNDSYELNGVAEGKGDYSYGYDGEEFVAESSADLSKDKNAEGKDINANRKLIRNASLDIQTKEFEKTISEITTYTSKIGGYVEKSTENGYSYDYYGSRNSSLTVRIPAEKFDDFINQISELAKITSKNITVDDITSNYIDTESRIKALKAEQSALMSILEKASSVSETLEIYDKLSDVNYRLENYEAQLKSYDQQVSYSTITISIDEVERVTPTTDEGFFSEIKNKLKDNLYSIGSGFKSFAIWFISSIPYILIWAAVITVVIIILKKIKKKIKSKKKKNIEE